MHHDYQTSCRDWMSTHLLFGLSHEMAGWATGEVCIWRQWHRSCLKLLTKKLSQKEYQTFLENSSPVISYHFNCNNAEIGET